MDVSDSIPKSYYNKWRNDPSMREWARNELPRADILTRQSATWETHSFHIGETIKKIEEIDACFMVQMEILKQKYLVSRGEQEQHLTRQRAVAAPIRILPIDVMELILNEYFNSAEVRIYNSGFRLGLHTRLSPLLVCRSWHNIATTRSSCWTTLKISFDVCHSSDYDDDDHVIVDRLLVSELAELLRPLLKTQFIYAKHMPVDVILTSTDFEKNMFNLSNYRRIVNSLLADYWPAMRSYTEESLFDFHLCQMAMVGSSSNVMVSLTLINSFPTGFSFPKLQKLIITGNDYITVRQWQLERLDCPALKRLQLVMFLGNRLELQKCLLRFPLLEHFALLDLKELSWDRKSLEKIPKHYAIRHVVLPAYGATKDSPIWYLLSGFPNLTGFGVQMKEHLDETNFGHLDELPPGSDPLQVAGKLQTLNVHWEGCLENEKIRLSDFAHFDNVTRLAFRPLDSDIALYGLPSRTISYSLLKDDSTGANPYFPRLKYLVFRGLVMKHSAMMAIIDTLRSKIRQAEDAHSEPRVSFVDCELSDNTWSVVCRIPNIEELPPRDAVEFLREIIRKSKFNKNSHSLLLEVAGKMVVWEASSC